MAVLGCYGLMVCSAQAAERWPVAVCTDIALLRKTLEGADQSAADRAKERFGLLLLQDSHCGISTKALQDADLAIVSRADKVERLLPKAVRPPVLCDTTPKAYGGSSTDCF